MEWHATGSLTAQPAIEHPELLAPSVRRTLDELGGEWAGRVGVASIDPALADTAEFCARYGVAMDASANCVVIRGKRGGETRFAACMVLATTRADVNGAVRRRLDARTASFAPMDEAVALSGMEYGGITPIGLPVEWPILIDAAVARAEEVVIGSGIRGSKLFLPGSALGSLPNAEVIEGLARPVE
ncbi:Cys-tRNA(Pro) deacylase, prolyl-tRNA editing enzyme YbaK/EbsC [Microbacterium sp. cf046]|uniref:YbaK/EbsC family protein n=1 Tax=Microbacterium sp. cf046 TaxID=1761803 RepID=UPI0008E146DA|nr:YbaK/EbsC family protein [Microbacterium sp. cf046]SFS15593.1 Cys-tRNA(Pro) deacylase, prolyl-tRNA editing enzyme YbaK/EbsC [Microbacterium sp. cf046]